MTERGSILRGSRKVNQSSLSLSSRSMTRPREKQQKRASFSNKSPEQMEIPPIPPLRRNNRNHIDHNIHSGRDSGDFSSSGATQFSAASNDATGSGGLMGMDFRRHSFGRSYPDLVSMGSTDTASNNSLKWYADFGCCEPSEKALYYMKKILMSRLWQIVVLIFTFVLLFGGSVQFYFSDHGADVYFDAIYIVTMVLLLADIVMMVYVESTYFYLKLDWRNIQIGSFKFWFDLISVLSLLFNLSAINIFAPHNSIINLENPEENTFGIRLFHFDKYLLLTIIIRTAKVARFFRIQYVLDVAARLRIFCIYATKKIQGFFPKRRGYGGYGYVRSSMTSLSTLRNAFNRSSKKDPSCQIYDADNSSPGSSTDFVRDQAARKIQRAYRKYRQKGKSTTKRGSRKKRSNEKERLRRLGLDVNSSNVSSDSTQASYLSRRRRRARKDRSQIGLAMNDKLTKLVAVGIIGSVTLSYLFTIQERDMTNTITVLSLHDSIQSLRNNPISDSNPRIFDMLLNGTVNTSTPNLLNFTFRDNRNGFVFNYANPKVDGPVIESITVGNGTISTVAFFDMTSSHHKEGYVSIIFTIFLIMIWLFGLVLFAGPVTYLVVIPIERMIRLLSMLVRDPLGYDNTKKYKRFATEELELASHTRWTNDNLKGMETQFLMETILCTGSLMKVGFGSAGAKIIRDYMKKSSRKKDLMRQKGIASTVYCIFMFCDIRQFTDATECLQEEVFLFTNKIAAVVHSICHSFGGSANKNIGDAFLLSWKLDEPADSMQFYGEELHALNHQADKALISVVNICIALCYENYYVEDVSETAKSKLKKKFEKRPGNLVQVGFGLHAGKAVEGAIGSPRKLDATYLGNAVELAETLESSTKKYGVSLLMSGQFYKLLHVTNQRRCRQIDEMFFILEYEADDPSDVDIQEDSEMHMRLFTCDIDLEALRSQGQEQTGFGLIFDQSSDTAGSHDLPAESISGVSNQSSVDTQSTRSSRRLSSHRNSSRRKGFHASMRRMSFIGFTGLRKSHENMSERGLFPFTNDESPQPRKFDKLILPSGPARYSSKLWQTDEMRVIRSRYNHVFFQKFNTGFEAYLKGKWDLAKSNLEFVKNRFGDKPSEVLLEKMGRSNFIPPHSFRLTLDFLCIADATVSLIFNNGSVESLNLMLDPLSMISMKIRRPPRLHVDRPGEDSPFECVELSPCLGSIGNQFVLKVKLRPQTIPQGVGSFRIHLSVRMKCPYEVNTHLNRESSENEVIFSSGMIRIDCYKLCVWLLELPENSVQAGEGFGDDDNVIDWFYDHGGRNLAINVLVHLKDSIGRVVSEYPNKLPVKTELVYEDGNPVPLKKANNRDAVYTPMRDEPILGPKKGSEFFAFRINDVSANHEDHGFKLKVSAGGGTAGVACGLMEQIIVTKSRPSGTSGAQKGGRTTLLQKSCNGAVPFVLSNGNSSVSDSDPISGYDASSDDSSLSSYSPADSQADEGKLKKKSTNLMEAKFLDREASENQRRKTSIPDVTPKRGGSVNQYASQILSPVVSVGIFPTKSPGSLRNKQECEAKTILPAIPTVTRTSSAFFDDETASLPIVTMSREKTSSPTGSISSLTAKSSSSSSTACSVAREIKNVRLDEAAQTVSVAPNEVLCLFTAGDTRNRCIACNERLVTGYLTEEHKIDCRLGLTLAPVIMLAKIQTEWKKNTNNYHPLMYEDYTDHGTCSDKTLGRSECRDGHKIDTYQAENSSDSDW